MEITLRDLVNSCSFSSPVRIEIWKNDAFSKRLREFNETDAHLYDRRIVDIGTLLDEAIEIVILLEEET